MSEKKYRVAQAGCGHRGQIHLKGFMNNQDRFELVGVSDLDEQKMREAVELQGITAPLYTDTEKMLDETRPDIFCFVTPPAIRLPLIELGVKYGVKGIALEKPMATTIKEAKRIKDLCSDNGIKAVVAHGHKYLDSMQKIKALIDSGEIGRIEKIHVGTRAWLGQLGTHYMDYALWINGGKRAEWAVGHIHGRDKLTDSHPSPDFVNGTVLLKNRVRIYFECGYLSEQNLEEDCFWMDDRLSVYGTHGYAWAECNGNWTALTRTSNGVLLKGAEEPWATQQNRIQNPYIRELADWLDDDQKIHPNNMEITYHGYEIIEALCISALDNRRVDLPLNTDNADDIFERMRKELPEQSDKI